MASSYGYSSSEEDSSDREELPPPVTPLPGGLKKKDKKKKSKGKGKGKGKGKKQKGEKKSEREEKRKHYIKTLINGNRVPVDKIEWKTVTIEYNAHITHKNLAGSAVVEVSPPEAFVMDLEEEENYIVKSISLSYIASDKLPFDVAFSFAGVRESGSYFVSTLREPVFGLIPAGFKVPPHVRSKYHVGKHVAPSFKDLYGVTDDSSTFGYDKEREVYSVPSKHRFIKYLNAFTLAKPQYRREEILDEHHDDYNSGFFPLTAKTVNSFLKLESCAQQMDNSVKPQDLKVHFFRPLTDAKVDPLASYSEVARASITERTFNIKAVFKIKLCHSSVVSAAVGGEREAENEGDE